MSRGILALPACSLSVRTDAFETTFGKEFMAFASRLAKPSHFLQPEEVGDAALTGGRAFSSEDVERSVMLLHAFDATRR